MSRACTDMKLHKLVRSVLMTLLIECAAPVPIQRVLHNIESVNGSDINIGCTSPLVGRKCESISHLVDGCSPDIDTSTSNWASQLVTVRKSGSTSAIPVTHVLLTFRFDTAMSLTGIELDLFLCPEWKIGAPYITVFANEERNLVLNYYGDLPFVTKQPNQSSCDSLSTVSIPFSSPLSGSSYLTWHVLVSQLGISIDWVHVGEIRFLGAGVSPETCTSTATTNTFTLSPSITTSDSRNEYTITKSTSIPQLVPPSVCGGRDCPTATTTITSLSGWREACEGFSSSVVIAVSAVSLLLIVTLTTVVLIQCLLMIRMRRSRNRNETYTEVMTPTTMQKDVPVSFNEAYAVTKMTTTGEEVFYELVK